MPVESDPLKYHPAQPSLHQAHLLRDKTCAVLSKTNCQGYTVLYYSGAHPSGCMCCHAEESQMVHGQSTLTETPQSV